MLVRTFRRRCLSMRCLSMRCLFILLLLSVVVVHVMNTRFIDAFNDHGQVGQDPRGHIKKKRQGFGSSLRNKVMVNYPDEDDAVGDKDAVDVDGDTTNTQVILRGDWPPQPLPNEPDFDVIRDKRIANLENAGAHGKAFTISELDLPSEERIKFRNARNTHAFNEYASNLIGVRRNLGNVRAKGCAERYPSDGLPQTSIIICFVNEAWSTLLRTVNSVMDYTPGQLVREIILVDDGSSWDFLGKPLEVYMSRYPKVKIVRTGSGLGLMQARMLGYKYTTAPTITFLDSHCECFPGWLEPLLTPLISDHKVVTTPVIEAINKDDLSVGIQMKHIQVGVVEFPSLMFGWRVQPPREVLRRNHNRYEPIRSPAMAGGLFTITRKYFDLLGGFDPGMKAWGGENIEMSFKIWMCGGRIETPPCSHVGHVFHGHTSYRRLRPDSRSHLLVNNARVASVWLDDEYLKHVAINNRTKQVRV